MADNKTTLTDAKIKTSLECCIWNDGCEQCPISEKCFFFYNKPYAETPEILRLTLDLINRLEADKEALIAGQETLQKALAEKNAEIERMMEFLDDKCDRCIEKERTEAIKEVADNLYRVFAGHSDYHGDTILTKIICLKEGKLLRTAEPIDTSIIKAEAVKELMFNLDNEISTYISEGKGLNIYAWLKNYVKERLGDAE